MMKELTLVCLLLLGLGVVSGQQFVTYVDAIHNWTSAEGIAWSLGVPGYADDNNYNIINLSFWLTTGPSDAVEVWSNPLNYMDGNPWGNTNQEVQKAWLNAFHNAGKKVLVSAFGATETPTTDGKDPVQTAQNLAQFVIDNQLDGADLDYEDNSAMDSGAGVDWVIQCSNTLRQLLPSSKGYIITHAPQAPYFMPSYAQGGYLTIDQKAGAGINFYNMQFYNQGDSNYTTYETMFERSNGWAQDTAILQIANNGVPLNKILVGKPVVRVAAANGFVDVNDLADILSQALTNTDWNAGAMGWEYSWDTTGNWIGTLSYSWNYYWWYGD